MSWYARSATKELIQRMSLEASVSDLASDPVFALKRKMQARIELVLMFLFALQLWTQLGYAMLEEPNVPTWAVFLLYGSAIFPAVGIVVTLRTCTQRRSIEKAMRRVVGRREKTGDA
jgi:hypothetical protein